MTCFPSRRSAAARSVTCTVFDIARPRTRDDSTPSPALAGALVSAAAGAGEQFANSLVQAASSPGEQTTSKRARNQDKRARKRRELEGAAAAEGGEAEEEASAAADAEAEQKS